jgi:hypothetical protein
MLRRMAHRGQGRSWMQAVLIGLQRRSSADQERQATHVQQDDNGPQNTDRNN